MSEKLSFKEKISYGFGDAGCSFVWQTVMLFLTFFYTDIYGLDPAVMGTMFLVVRFVDAFADPIIGAIVDRTSTRWGKYRPYLLWMGIPFGLACTMAFYTPDFSPTGKVVYAYCSYIFMMVMYSAINVPYCAMANAITDDSEERISMQSYRFAMNTGGGFIVTLVALPLVHFLGQGNLQKGYFEAMMIMSVVALALFVTCFMNTRERINLDNPEKSSVKKDITQLMTSKPWKCLFVVNVVLLVGIILKNSSAMYYVNYVMKRPDIATYFLGATMLANVFGALISGPLFSKLDKVTTYKTLSILSGVVSAALYFTPVSNIYITFALIFLFGAVNMSATPLLWGMISDVVDFEKYRSKRSLSGLVFSTNLFAIKVGIAIGGALLGWMLAWVGYDGALTIQNPGATQFIKELFTVIPGAIFALQAAVLMFYELSNKKMSEIKKRLKLA